MQRQFCFCGFSLLFKISPGTVQKNVKKRKLYTELYLVYVTFILQKTTVQDFAFKVGLIPVVVLPATQMYDENRVSTIRYR